MDLESKRRQVAGLRAKTVANGASEGEAQNAARLADWIEQRYDLRPEPPPPGPRPRRAPQPRGGRVVLTRDQHRRLEQGETVTKVQLGDRHRFRLADGVLFHQATAVADEVAHPVLGVESSCGNVIVRYA